MPGAVQAPAPQPFYKLSVPGLVAPVHWLPGRWTPMHYNCSSQLSKQPKATLERAKWAMQYLCSRDTSPHLVHRLITVISTVKTVWMPPFSLWLNLKYFTLQCFRASLNSLFFMASLALFNAVFTSLLDILYLSRWNKETQKRNIATLRVQNNL